MREGKGLHPNQEEKDRRQEQLGLGCLTQNDGGFAWPLWGLHHLSPSLGGLLQTTRYAGGS